MIQLCNKISIRKSQVKVFNFLRDFRNIPKWNYYVINVFPLDSKDSATYYHQVRRNDEQDFEVVETKPDKKIVIRTLPGQSISFQREFTLGTNQEGHCVINDKFDLDTGHPGILQSLFKTKMKNAVKKNLTKLKELLETGSSKLQDGRIATHNLNY